MRWNQQFKYNFPESDQELGMSRKDLQFMDSVSQSARLVEVDYCIGLTLRKKELQMPNDRVVEEQRAIKVSQESFIP